MSLTPWYNKLLTPFVIFPKKSSQSILTKSKIRPPPKPAKKERKKKDLAADIQYITIIDPKPLQENEYFEKPKGRWKKFCSRITRRSKIGSDISENSSYSYMPSIREDKRKTGKMQEEETELQVQILNSIEQPNWHIVIRYYAVDDYRHPILKSVLNSQPKQLNKTVRFQNSEDSLQQKDEVREKLPSISSKEDLKVVEVERPTGEGVPIEQLENFESEHNLQERILDEYYANNLQHKERQEKTKLNRRRKRGMNSSVDDDDDETEDDGGDLKIPFPKSFRHRHPRHYRKDEEKLTPFYYRAQNRELLRRNPLWKQFRGVPKGSSTPSISRKGKQKSQSKFSWPLDLGVGAGLKYKLDKFNGTQWPN